MFAADVFPSAGSGAVFSDAAIHSLVARRVNVAGLGDNAKFQPAGREIRFSFRFDKLEARPGKAPLQRGTCTLPDGQTLRFTANDEQGARTPNGTVRIFAGLRSDPFVLAWLVGVLDRLAPPKWPEEALGKIDRQKASQGKALFMTHCAGCHNAYPYTWTAPNKFGKRFIQVGLVPQKHMGVDPAQIERTQAYAITGHLGAYLPEPYKDQPIIPTGAFRQESQRTKKFYVGREFDPVKVGIDTSGKSGNFLFDTSLIGNSNAGHSFERGPRGDGVVGPLLSENERWALVEYLKSIPEEAGRVTLMAARRMQKLATLVGPVRLISRSDHKEQGHARSSNIPDHVRWRGRYACARTVRTALVGRWLARVSAPSAFGARVENRRLGSARGSGVGRLGPRQFVVARELALTGSMISTITLSTSDT